MYKIGNYLVYKKDVCEVKDIKKNHLNNQDYYVLIPIYDDSLIIDVPIENRCGYIRDLIKIIKTTYLRNKERIDNKRKSGDRDEFYFNKAEKYLYNEFGLVLGMKFHEVKNYIIDKVMSLEG